ncbi:MAG: hypothetical protein EA361_01420 [Bacteroidetes bacterium]|nr:MAG: hypothetical protein EA361_01420 [Bacteroidota bacterium]
MYWVFHFVFTAFTANFPFPFLSGGGKANLPVKKIRKIFYDTLDRKHRFLKQKHVNKNTEPAKSHQRIHLVEFCFFIEKKNIFL